MRNVADTYRGVLIGLGRSAPHQALERAKTVLSGDGFRFEARRQTASDRLQAIEIPFIAHQPIDWLAATKRLRAFQAEYGVDLVVQPDAPTRREKRLLMIDMDSTLVQTEGIDELAKEAGVGEAVSKITRRAMNGELDFAVALRERVGLLQGLSATALDRVAERTRLSQGAETLIQVLRANGCAVAVVSGGFDYFTVRLQAQLPLDYAFANRLEIRDGHLTGQLVGEIVDGKRKAELLGEVALKEGASLDRVLAIGDGANDLLMLGRAGLGVAYNAKPSVREAAPATLSVPDLVGILFLLGYTESELTVQTGGH